MKLASNAILSELFKDPKVPAFVLYTVCIHYYGTEVYTWEPETLYLEIIDDFKVDLAEENKDKIQAAITLTETNTFYENFRVFEGICKSFNNQNPDLEYITPLTPEECAWGIMESELIDSTPEEFSEEVKAYVRNILKDHGLFSAPTVLKFSRHGDNFDVKSFVPDELKDKTMTLQKVKHKKIELYCQSQKDLIAKYFKKYYL